MSSRRIITSTISPFILPVTNILVCELSKTGRNPLTRSEMFFCLSHSWLKAEQNSVHSEFLFMDFVVLSIIILYLLLIKTDWERYKRHHPAQTNKSHLAKNPKASTSKRLTMTTDKCRFTRRNSSGPVRVQA